jgi:hypothetical protein
MNNFNLTLFEACEFLNRSKKSISRYIRQGLLHPKKVKSQQGTLEYRFSKIDLEAFKERETQDKTRQDTQDRQDQTRQNGQTEETPTKEPKTQDIKEETRPDKTDQPRQDKTQETGQDSEIINLLKETTGLLKGQLVKKDEQIKDLGGKIDQLIERSRETNILIGQLQSKVLMLEKPKEPINKELEEQTGQDTPDKTGQDRTIKPLKKDTQAKPKDKIKTPKKRGFWQRVFK